MSKAPRDQSERRGAHSLKEPSNVQVIKTFARLASHIRNMTQETNSINNILRGRQKTDEDQLFDQHFDMKHLSSNM